MIHFVLSKALSSFLPESSGKTDTIENDMDYTYTVLAAEMLRRRDAPVLSSHEEELICMKEQAAKAKAEQKSDQPFVVDKSERESLGWLQRFVLGAGSN